MSLEQPNFDAYRGLHPNWPRVEEMRERMFQDLAILALTRQVRAIGAAKMQWHDLEIECEDTER